MDKLRDFMKSWPGRILLMLCLAPMVLLGLESYFSGGRLTPDQVAKVGDTVIGLNELQNEITNARTSLSEQTDASLINEQALKNQTLDMVLNRTLLETQATKLGMQVSDEMITAMLGQDPAFLDADGKFSNDLFASYLQSRHLTKDRLFAMQRRELNLRTLMNGILSTVIYPKSQVGRLLDLQSESRQLWVKRLSWQNYADKVTVSDSDIDAYYTAHKDTLVHPNRVDLAYIELSKDTINVPAPSDDELKTAYQAYLRANNMGQKELAQILLTGDDAKARAETIAKELASGKSFEELAKVHSDDPSGKTGGGIGSYNPAIFGNDAEKVEKAILTLAKGEISKPVETKFGVHLFKITGTSEAPSLDSLKATLVKEWTEQRREALFREQVGQVNVLIADGFGLKDVAGELKLELKTLTDYQDKNQPIMGQPAIMQSAFDEMLIADGGVSGNIDVAGVTLWVQPSNYRPSAPMSLDEAKTQIKEQLVMQKASELALADANSQAKNFAGELSGFTAVGMASRQTPVLNDEERSSLFVHDSQDDKPAVWAVATGVGASVMVGGKISVEATNRMSEQERLMATTMIRNVAAQDHLEDYLHYLRTVHTVEMNDEALKGL